MYNVFLSIIVFKSVCHTNEFGIFIKFILSLPFLILTLKIQFGLEWSFYTKNVCDGWVATQQKHTKNVDNLDYNNIEYNTKKESNLQKSQSFRLQFLKKTFNFFI